MDQQDYLLIMEKYAERRRQDPGYKLHDAFSHIKYDGVPEAEMVSLLPQFPDLQILTPDELDDYILSYWKANFLADAIDWLAALGFKNVAITDIQQATVEVQTKGSDFVFHLADTVCVLVSGHWRGNPVTRLLVEVDQTGEKVAQDMLWDKLEREQRGLLPANSPTGQLKEWRILRPSRSRR